MSMREAGWRMRSSGCRSSARPLWPPRCHGAGGPLLVPGGLLPAPPSGSLLLPLPLLPSSSTEVGAGRALLNGSPSTASLLLLGGAALLLLLRRHSKPPAHATQQGGAALGIAQAMEAPQPTVMSQPTGVDQLSYSPQLQQGRGTAAARQ